ncbi:hypothetical protein T492DRAFT_1095344 [Pavlovales sp. CCMP2436]|nr:hypothetical protein T492DRAFT_1095344 [Pavlovales sp. CCMP2436]
MLGVEVREHRRLVTPTSTPSRSVVTTPQIILTIPMTASRQRGVGQRSTTKAGMIGHATEREPTRARKFNEMTYTRASDPYEVYRDSSNTLANTLGRRTHSHPAAHMSDLRTGPPPASLGRGSGYAGDWQSYVSMSQGMLNLDQLLPPRKPRLPSSARSSLKKRTNEHGTQTISTIGTQTEASTGTARHAAGGKENAHHFDVGSARGKGSVGAGAAAKAPHVRHGALNAPRDSARWAQPANYADAATSELGSHRVSLTPSSSADQLEQLDSLLHEHQQRLRERVDGARAEQSRKQKEWFAAVGQSLPTPQRKVAADSLGLADAHTHSSRPGTAPPTPSRVTTTPAASPHRRSYADAETAPSVRSSLESLAELEALLEEQHTQLIQRGYIAPSEDW